MEIAFLSEAFSELRFMDLFDVILGFVREL